MSNLPWGNNSVGFVYFDNSPNTATGSGENLDFVEFSNSGSPKGNFSPTISSSPQQFRQRNSNYYRGKRNSKNFGRFYNNTNHTNSFNDCSRNSSNSSFNYSPYNNSGNYRKFNKQHYDKDDISQYYDPSMMEDPWAALQKDLESNSQNESDKSISETFNRFRVEANTSNTSLCDDTTDSQEDSQISTEESS